MPDISRKITPETVLIVGAGPSGLLLGHQLHRYGIPFHIVEKNSSTHQHSRAIGIHPVSLAIFRKIGLLDPFLERGLEIRKGAAYLDQTWVGSIHFSHTPHSHPFILSLPQYTTEHILQEHLLARRPGCISYDTELAGLQEHDHGATAFLRPADSA
jgi:2-polyprenyl-6-methoxyphenol hydroxylase-like FAD-dependent oxidoreductase